ncbi:MAG: DUF370 domain-containing protein [Oscillospiraceae bacterium]|nr:DUF370 domain-containing protein [Oscillospiraceae bacterium]
MASLERILSVVAPDSAPVKRMISDTKERGLLIDATFGRKTGAVIVMDSGHIVLSALSPEEIGKAVEDNEEK